MIEAGASVSVTAPKPPSPPFPLCLLSLPPHLMRTSLTINTFPRQAHCKALVTALR